jgi:hypothetical protein
MNKFELLPHQLFIKNHVGTKFETENRMLLFHGVGSGKTCSAITAGLEFYRKKGDDCTIITITPASLKKNFEKELFSQCGRTQLVEQPSNKSTKKKLFELFNIVSFQQFVKHMIPNRMFDRNTLLIVDEVQNIISDSGKMYKSFANLTKETDVSVIFLSGTPVFNDSKEIALLANLLQGKGCGLIDVVKFKTNYGLQIDKDDERSDDIDDLISGKYDVNINNSTKLKSFLKNKISFFKGHDLAMYPKQLEYNVYCPMSKFQYDGYNESLGKKTLDFDYHEMSNVFLSGPRITSNVVYPDGGISMKSAKRFRSFPSKKYAIKFNICIRNIKKAKGPVFVYSNFVESGGIKTFVKILKNEFKFEEYVESDSSTKTSEEQTHKFAVYKAGENERNCKILSTYNSYENKDGNLIKMIIGSPTMKEGCTLLRTREVHVLDPSWNESKTRQIIGRAVRYCSHIDLPETCQIVKVFHYLAVSSSDTTKAIKVLSSKTQPVLKETTVDIYMKKLSLYKNTVISKYVTLMKEVALDCNEFKKYNQPPEYTCDNAQYPDKVDETPHNTTTKSTTNKTKRKEKSRNTKIDIDNLMQNLDRKTTTCSKHRKPRDGNKCPDEYPFMKLNKYNVKCCYKKNADAVKGCPTERRVVSGNCSEKYPFMRKNKYDVDCCYKKIKK